MAHRYIFILVLMCSVATLSAQNIDSYTEKLVNPGPYVTVSVNSIKGFRPLSYLGKYINTFYSYNEMNQINKAFEYPDFNKIKIDDMTYTKTSLTNRRFLNYFVAQVDWTHTIGYLYCGKTNKSIVCGTYPLSVEENTKEKNQEIRQLLDQAVSRLVAAGY